MNKHDLYRDEYMLTGSFRKRGYDWWWHSFTAVNEKTGDRKPFFFEFFIINPALGKNEPILGQAKESKEKGLKPSYLMVKVGTWGEKKCQLHRYFAIDDVKIHGKAPFSVDAKDCHLDEHHSYGSVEIKDSALHPEWMCDDGKIEWDISIDKKIAFNVGYGASTFFRFIKAFEMYWHAEGMKTEYEGYITLNGEKYLIRKEDSNGYADKNWGRDFTTPWVWLSTNNLTSRISGKKLENTVFDIGGGRPKVFFVALNRKLLGQMTYEGKDYEFNFSKFWTGSKTEFDCKESETQIIWHVRQETFKYVMISDITCEKKDMLLVNYEAPDGVKRHNRLWNGGNGKGRIQLFRKEKGKEIIIDDLDAIEIGCEYGEYDK